MNPQVTVLMPVYNCEKFLSEAIGSILKQTYADFEFLIINDGSTDRSREIVLSFNDKRIRLIDNERNLKLVSALNRGLGLARGKYIARQDADDVSLPRRLEKQAAYLEENPSVILLGSWAEVMDEHGKKIGIWRRPREHALIGWRFLFDNCLVHSAVMFRREEALKLGGYQDIMPGEDYDLWIKMAKAGKVVQLPEILLKYRICEGISVRYAKEQGIIREQVAIEYAKSILPEAKDNILHYFLKRTKSRDLSRRQIEEIVRLARDMRDRYFEIYKPGDRPRDEINRDIRRWFCKWAINNWNRPRVCFYLASSVRYMSYE